MFDMETPYDPTDVKPVIKILPNILRVSRLIVAMLVVVRYWTSGMVSIHFIIDATPLEKNHRGRCSEILEASLRVRYNLDTRARSIFQAADY